MSIYIFTGPTLSAEEGKRELDATFLPPAAQGDVYLAALDKPRAIGIIDGYFERIPSISHKEVLWAMSRGVHVFGSASMGALRAAELGTFGMTGVGVIYEAFAGGELSGDDEVAVAHGLADDGYRAVSEAMVNIRATLRAAELAGAISEKTRAVLTRVAKGLFYPDRCYPIILARAAELGVPRLEIDALNDFLPAGRVHQKREDALSMLRAMREQLSQSGEPKRVTYHFEHTDAWEHIRESAEARWTGGPAPEASVIEALQRAGALALARSGAMARALALELSRQRGWSVEPMALQAAVDRFRRERGLLQPGDFQRWIADNRVNDIERFFRDEAQVRRIEEMLGTRVAQCLTDHLRSTGEYAPLVARGREEQPALEAPVEARVAG